MLSGRPTALQDRTRDSDDDDYQDRDYDVAALANNLSQAFRYGIYSNDDNEEAHGSLERDDEDVYFDDESAEVVISSLRLGDDHESGSVFTNSNWFAFEDDRIVKELTTAPVASPSLNTEETGVIDGGDDDEVIVDDLVDAATSEVPKHQVSLDSPLLDDLSKGSRESGAEIEKPPEWVEWRESSDSVLPTDATPDSAESSIANPDSIESSNPIPDSAELSGATPDSVEPSKEATDSVEPSDASTDFAEPSTADRPPVLPIEESQVESESHTDDVEPITAVASPSSTCESIDLGKSNVRGSPESEDADLTSTPSRPSGTLNETPSSETSHLINVAKPTETEGTSGAAEHEEKN